MDKNFNIGEKDVATYFTPTTKKKREFKSSSKKLKMSGLIKNRAIRKNQEQ